MKKIILLLIPALLIIGASFGQQIMSSSLNTVASGTSAAHVDADTSTHFLKTVGSFNVVTIQPLYVKGTGTPGGRIFIKASINGTDYKVISDTSTITNVARQAPIWTFTKANYVYYQAVFETSGTQTGTASAMILLRQ